MKIGSLFSGIGGLERGVGSELPGARVAWFAESDPAAQRVLATHYPEVKCYTDVRQIDEQTEAVDLVVGGFPCQDISTAGKGAGLDGERSGLWREFARVLRVLRPGVAFIENVPPLLVRGLDVVLADLAALGFDAEWTTVRAADVGAPHRRERIFILAYTDRERVRQLAELDQRRGRGVRAAERGDAEPLDDREAVADADREPGRAGASVGGGGGAEVQGDGRARPEPARHGALADAHLAGREGDASGGLRPGGRRKSAGRGDGALADPAGAGCARAQPGEERGGIGAAEPRCGDQMADAHGGRREGERLAQPGGLCSAPGRLADRRGDERYVHRFPPGPSAIAGWDGPQPAIRRGDDGVPGRSHRLRLLGNAVVPQQAARAWRTLIARC